MKELTVNAIVENIPAVTAFIDEKLEELACSPKAQCQIDVALDELLCNIARYAYAPGTGDATVRFGYDEDSRMVAITFIDAGKPFNPLEKPDPDTSLPASERKIGGLGIYLVRKTMDRMEYRYENGTNQLTIYKKI